MSFAQEIRDFSAAFGVVSNVLGTKESREADRLDNEYRRAQIDYTNARMNEITAGNVDLDNYLSGGYRGNTFAYDANTEGGGGGPGGPSLADTGTGAVVSGAGTSFTEVPGKGAKTAGGSLVPTPTSPARTAAGAVVPTSTMKTGAVDDSDVSGAGGTSGSLIGKATGDPLKASYQVNIRDQTSMTGVQPRALNVLNVASNTAKQMGIKLVVTAGRGGGHRSHGMGTELDLIGYRADGSKWTAAERAQVAASGASVGANRFGLYPGGSLHIGLAGQGRPSAVWGANGIVTGPSSRQFSNNADIQFLNAFNSGKLFGGTPGAGTGMTFAPSGQGDYDAFANARNAIAAIESRGSGDYNAVNRNSGALGRYQVMPANLPSWSKAALGREVSTEEFLSNSDIQDQIFDHRFGQLFQKYGTMQDAASAWFTGRPLAGGGAGATDQNLTGQQYVNKFNKFLGAGGAGGGGARGGAGGGGSLITGSLSTGMLPDYEFASSSEANPMASSTADTMMLDRSRGDVMHDVQPGDTLWDLANQYDLNSYMDIVKANPEITNPDLIYPEQNLVIPGAASAPATPTMPEPILRPALEVDMPRPHERPSQHPISSTGDTVAVGENVRPAGGPGATPPTSYTPSAENLPAELQRAQDYRARIAVDATMPPASKDAMLRALDVKIQQITHAMGGATGETYTPTETVRPVEQRPGLNARATENNAAVENIRRLNERIKARGAGPGAGPERRGAVGEELTPGPGEGGVSSADPETLSAAGMTSPTGDEFEGPIPQPRPERGPVNQEQIGGAAGDETVAGTGGEDELGPAQASIAAVTAQWKISPDGHVVGPNGEKSANNSFKSGRNAARAGSNWLSKLFFPSDNQGVDIAEDAADDGSSKAADAYVRGRGALKKSDMQKVHAAIDKWAADNGLTLTESERNMRALGVMFDYWTTRGEPDKAQAIAGSMLQYHRVLYGQYSAIAKAALKSGDPDKAVEAAVKAYAQIPDGRDITVTGDASNGWQFSYVNEETGKTISKKVMSPQQLTGMIMSMSPDDVDKFLVKAAGQDELPEPSAAFSAAMARLNDTPPGQRPVFDAEAAAYFDSGEASLYAQGYSAALDSWKSFEDDRQRTSDTAHTAAAITGRPGGAVPIDEATPAAATATTPAATPTAPAATAPAATAPAATVPAATAPAATAPVATPTPAAEPAAPTYVRGFLGGEPVNTSNPTVFKPGPNRDFGMGPPPSINTEEYRQIQQPTGRESVRIDYEQANKDYERELQRRERDFQDWRVTQTGAVDDTDSYGPPKSAEYPFLSATPPTGAPYINPRLPITGPGDVGQRWVPDTVPGPLDGEGGYGRGQKPYVPPHMIRNQTPENIAYMNSLNEQAVARWEREGEVNKIIYDAQIAGQRPVARKLENTDYEAIRTATHDRIVKMAGPASGGVSSAYSQEQIDFLTQNEGMISSTAAEIFASETDQALAIGSAINMVFVNPNNPSMPNWRAFRDPNDPGAVMVQPLNLQGEPVGSVLYMRDRTFLPMARLWEDASRQLIGAKAQPPGALQSAVNAVSNNVAPEAPEGRSRVGVGLENMSEWIDELLGFTGGATPLPPGAEDPNRQVPTGN